MRHVYLQRQVIRHQDEDGKGKESFQACSDLGPVLPQIQRHDCPVFEPALPEKPYSQDSTACAEKADNDGVIPTAFGTSPAQRE